MCLKWIPFRNAPPSPDQKTGSLFFHPLFLLSVLFGFAPPARAFLAPAQEQLPALDVRKPTAPNVVAENKAGALGALQRQLPTAQVEFDEIIASPKMISASDGFLSGAGGKGRAISEPVAAQFAVNDVHRT